MRPIVNFRLQALQNASDLSPNVSVFLQPLRIVWLELPQYGHFGFLPRFIYSPPFKQWLGAF